MWIIAGTIPDPDFSLLVPEGPAPRSASLSEAGLHLPDGRTVPVERGTAALAATALQTCAALGSTPPALLLAGDTGSGSGSWTITVSPAENLVFFFAAFPFTVTLPCSSSFCAPLRVRVSTVWARN